MQPLNFKQKQKPLWKQLTRLQVQVKLRSRSKLKYNQIAGHKQDINMVDTMIIKHTMYNVKSYVM